LFWPHDDGGLSSLHARPRCHAGRTILELFRKTMKRVLVIEFRLLARPIAPSHVYPVRNACQQVGAEGLTEPGNDELAAGLTRGTIARRLDAHALRRFLLHAESRAPLGMGKHLLHLGRIGRSVAVDLIERISVAPWKIVQLEIRIAGHLERVLDGPNLDTFQ